MKWIVEHQKATAKYSYIIGEEFNLSNEELSNLYIAAQLHDIGKSKIPSNILLKKDKLDNREMETIKHHVKYGAYILKRNNYNKKICDAVLYHHERVDGKGYLGIEDKDINILSKIIAIADAYDCMISERPYHRSKTKEEALNEIYINLSSQFDATLGEIFIKLMKK